MSPSDPAADYIWSPNPFGKMFKKAPHMNLTEYVHRVRIAKARNLLLNPNFRIGEIACPVGFGAKRSD